MSILEQIKSELPWLDDKVSFDLTRGKPSADQLNVTQRILSILKFPLKWMELILEIGWNQKAYPLQENLVHKFFQQSLTKQ